MEMDKQSNKEQKNANKEEKKNRDHRSLRKGQKERNHKTEKSSSGRGHEQKKININDNPGDTIRKEPKMSKPE